MYQILIIFGTNIPDNTSHHKNVEAPNSPNICFCTTWERQNVLYILLSMKTGCHIIDANFMNC